MPVYLGVLVQYQNFLLSVKQTVVASWFSPEEQSS